MYSTLKYNSKKKIYSLFISKLSKDAGFCLIDGTNADDLLSDRPGLKAIDELGVSTPLARAELNKEEIRHLSYCLKLSTWDRPASSCLATRIPTGSEISRQKVELVDRCENYLHTLGFLGCRVRFESGSVKIELANGDSERFSRSVIRAKVTNFFTEMGIQKIFLDLSERPATSSIASKLPTGKGLG